MRYAILVAILYLTCSASAQLNGKYSFRHIDQNDGLLHTMVRGIAQDSRGFIWVHTSNGLQRYDGSRFVNYQNIINQTPFEEFKDSQLYADTIKNHILVTKRDHMERIDLSSNGMESIGLQEFLIGDTVHKATWFTDDEDEKWLISEYGIIQYNRDTSIRNGYYFNINPAQSNRNTYILKEHLTGNFIGHNLNHLILGDSRTKKISSSGGKNLSYPLLVQFNSIRNKTMIRYVMQDHYHNIWIIMWNEKMYRFDPNANKLISYSIKELKRKHGNFKDDLTILVNAVYEDRQKNIWFATDYAGLMMYDREKDDFNFITSDDKIANGLKYNFSINSILQDQDDNIWLGTDRGISIFNPYRNYFRSIRHIEDNNASLPKYDINDIVETKNGEILIATWGGGISIYDSNWNFLRNIRFSDPPEYNLIWSLVKLDDGTVWAGTQGGYIHLYNGDGFTTIHPPEAMNSTITTLTKDHDGNVLLGLNNGKMAFWKKSEKKFYKFNDEETVIKLPYYGPTNIFIDHSNRCWVGTSEGLFEYNKEKQTYINFYQPGQSNQEFGNYIQGMEDYNDSMLIVGTVYKGVYLFNKNSKTFSQPLAGNELSRTSVYAIKKDSENNIWLTANFSVYKISNDFLKLTRFNIDHTMMNAAFGSSRFYEFNNGQWASSTFAEIVSFDPQQFSADMDDNIDIAISGLKVFERTFYIDSFLAQQKPVLLPYDENFITIEFSALDYIGLRVTNYQYRLIGIDQDWIHTSSNEFANYTDLKPGEYIFEVKADKGERSSPVLSFPIVIQPPWWGTFGFRILALLGLSAIVYFILKSRIQAIRKGSELKHRIAETEMMALRSQMNPHFIFNCINGIDAMIQSNDKYRATVYLNKFAKLIRNILDISKHNKVPFSKDIETLQLYIDLELFRHDGKFTASIVADDELIQNDYAVPPLIIQPYVENAILHGLRHRSGQEGILKVTVAKNEHHIVYTIEDNGIGRKIMNGDSNSKGYGMQIGNDRIRLFNKEEVASVTITDLETNGEASGTRVQVQLRTQ